MDTCVLSEVSSPKKLVLAFENAPPLQIPPTVPPRAGYGGKKTGFVPSQYFKPVCGREMGVFLF